MTNLPGQWQPVRQVQRGGHFALHILAKHMHGVAQLCGLVRQVLVENDLGDDLQRKLVHLFRQIERRAGLPTLDPTLGVIDDSICIPLEVAGMKASLDDWAVPGPRVAVGNDEAFPLDFLRNARICRLSFRKLPIFVERISRIRSRRLTKYSRTQPKRTNVKSPYSLHTFSAKPNVSACSLNMMEDPQGAVARTGGVRVYWHLRFSPKKRRRDPTLRLQPRPRTGSWIYVGTSVRNIPESRQFRQLQSAEPRNECQAIDVAFGFPPSPCFAVLHRWRFSHTVIAQFCKFLLSPPLLAFAFHLALTCRQEALGFPTSKSPHFTAFSFRWSFVAA